MVELGHDRLGRGKVERRRGVVLARVVDGQVREHFPRPSRSWPSSTM
eukprot:CAMPEP_0114125792 /NCGR_PEP_ID=MMETSP0043_2-20121206/9486_1 /TAXON_ID=464988 /ORGANISM="Hemiselmis andersenii, Strain CCMP644" /LENGTH=46 /DNA_ID= /DNA_START= /DNA_END= /DNA_ORIENTATION=